MNAKETTANNETCPAAEFAENCGLKLDSVFVPQSLSRNAGDSTLWINWRVRVSDNKAQAIVTDYTQGIGHARLKFGPGPKPGVRTVAYHEAELGAAERGIGAIKPKLVDVLYSLVLDADTADYTCFEDWAESYGYDVDSRKAESLYNTCRDTARQLAEMIDLEAAREAFQDY